MKKQLALLFFITAFFMTNTLAFAQGVPKQISYQGKLLENGVPINGHKSITFSFVDTNWSETHENINISNGLYSVNLGKSNPIPLSICKQTNLKLQIVVDNVKLEPDVEIFSVMRSVVSHECNFAKVAERVEGDAIYTDDEGNIGIGTKNPQANLDVNGSIRLGQFKTSNRPVCYTNTAGTLIFDKDIGKPFICNGSVWKPLDSDFDSDGIVDWNDADDTNPEIKHVELKPENIKKGISILGVTGMYSNSIGFKSNVLVDFSNVKSIVRNTGYSSDQLQNVVNSQHRIEKRHYFLSLLNWMNVGNDVISLWGKALIGCFNIETASKNYYELDLIHLDRHREENWIEGDNIIRQCNGKIYFIKNMYQDKYGTKTHQYSWVEFNTENNSMSSKVTSSLPCNSNVNNTQLIINNRLWKCQTEWLLTNKPQMYFFQYRMFMTSYIYN